MKKIISCFIAVLLIASSLPVHAAEQIKITVDGKVLPLDVPPTVVNGRTLIPLRAIFESLGATIQWDDKSKTVKGEKGDTKIILTIGKKTATVNEQAKSLDVPGIIKDSRTMVPARFIAESLGAKVDWNGSTQTVMITSNEKPTTYKVLKVIDGDTIEISYKGKKERVRLSGINSDESVHPDKTKNTEFGKIASEFTKKRLEGKEIILEFDVQERDQYGRLLAYVYLADTNEMYNKTLVMEGFGNAATYPPNTKYSKEFVALEKQARENNKGLWAYDDTPAKDTKDATSKQAVNSEIYAPVIIKSIDLVGEIVIIENVVCHDIDMSFWKIISTEGNQTYSFPKGFIIKTETTVTIASGTAKGDLKWVSTTSIWNNKGDIGQLINAEGEIVSEY